MLNIRSPKTMILCHVGGVLVTQYLIGKEDKGEV